MAAVLFHHVVGDLIVGKPRLQEFCETSSVGEALDALQAQTYFELPIWRPSKDEDDSMQERFIGMLDMVDIMGHLASEKNLKDPEGGLSVAVSEIVVPNNALLRQIAPGTRLFDALEIMKQGARQLLVPIVRSWRSVSRRFSMLYYGKWMNATELDVETDGGELGYCLLTREDLVRFLMGCMGALAPIPLMSIEALGAINKSIHTLEASAPARTALILRQKQKAETIAVVETNEQGGWRIVGEISAFRAKNCNFEEAAWALAGASALDLVLNVGDDLVGPSKYTKEGANHKFSSPQFFAASINDRSRRKEDGRSSNSGLPEKDHSRQDIARNDRSAVLSAMEVEVSPTQSPENSNSSEAHHSSPRDQSATPDLLLPKMRSSKNDRNNNSPADAAAAVAAELQVINRTAAAPKPPPRSSRFSTRPNNRVVDSRPREAQHQHHHRHFSSNLRTLTRGMEPMTCRADLSLAAVMAQLLTYRGTHVWVTDERGGPLGVVGYEDIIRALTNTTSFPSSHS